MASLAAVAALACYAVGAHTPVDLSAASWNPAAYARPTTVALAPDGSLAVVLPRADGHPSVVRVIAPNGAAKDYEAPNAGVLAKQLFAYRVDAHGRRAYPDARIASVALRDGAPIVTVTNDFSGAYSGTETGSYRWTRSGWVDAVSSIPGRHRNTWVVAASGSVALFGTDHRAESPAYIADHTNGDRWAASALVVTKDREIFVPTVTPTGIAGADVVGYVALPAERADARVPFAVVRHDYRVSRLFGGIAWSKNRAGDVTGDNRADLGHEGRPVVYHGGAVMQLSPSEGSAFGINDRGIVAGAMANTAFVYAVHGTKREPTRLDDLLADRSWHAIAAYAVSPAGTVMALASHHGGEPELVRLMKTAGSAGACGEW